LLRAGPGEGLFVRALRAPSEDGGVVAEPPLEQVGALLADNRARLSRGPTLLGAPWAEVRAGARREALAAARNYMTGRGEPVPAAADGPLFLAGHQPELFHPGVWAKNFALTGLARRHGGVALNLMVDNDAVKSTAIRLPAPPAPDFPRPHLVTEPFDIGAGDEPWEERGVRSAEVFRSFAARAVDRLRPWGYEPLLGPFWADVIGREGPIGERFAGARRDLERAWGCHNLELPLSTLCRTGAFATFALHILTNLPQFHALYNGTVRAYRARHGLRSRNHPVPDLSVDGDWLEAPFWGWRAGRGRRAHLFCRLGPDKVELRTSAGPWPALPRRGADWLSLESQGLKVRSRALTTTLFARLFLGDLFLHGIGGAKYDELTDELMRRFYEVEPPAFLALSATRWLPLPTAPVTADDHARLTHRLRDLSWNPQRYLPPAAGLDGEAMRKEELARQAPATRAERRERYRELRELNERLRGPLEGQAAALRRELEEVDRQFTGNAVVRRRDYAFCLYPEASLRPFLGRFL
jgi:hypothetical protein